MVCSSHGEGFLVERMGYGCILKGKGMQCLLERVDQLAG